MYEIFKKDRNLLHVKRSKGVLSRRNVTYTSFFKGLVYLRNVEKFSMTGV